MTSPKLLLEGDDYKFIDAIKRRAGLGTWVETVMTCVIGPERIITFASACTQMTSEQARAVRKLAEEMGYELPR